MKICTLFILIYIVSCSYLFAGGEAKDASTGEPLISITVSNVVLRDALLKLAEQALPLHTIINFEQTRSGTLSSGRITIDLKAVSITNALQELLKNDPQYLWEKNQQMINVFTIEDKRDPTNVLNQIIPVIEIHNKDRYEIIGDVLEACNTLTSGRYKILKNGNAADRLQVYRIPYREFGVVQPVLKKHDFTFKNLSVRDILNALSEKENIRWEVLSVEANREISLLVFSVEGNRSTTSRQTTIKP